MVTAPKTAVDEASIQYQARTKLAVLAKEIASARSLNSVNDKILLATKIRLWLKALDYKEFLTRNQREKIWYCLISISGIYAFPTAPVLGERTQPSILIGESGDNITNIYYDSGTPFASSVNVAPGVETVDSFSMSLGTGCMWSYTVTDGTTNQRSGVFVGTWLPDGSDWDANEVSTAEIGDTSDVVLDITVTAGEVILQATEASAGWIVSGRRYLIN